MKLFTSLLLLLCASTAFAVNGGTRAVLLGHQAQLNSSAPDAAVQARLGDKVVKESVHTLKLKYDFALQGGASGTALNLVGEDGKAAKLPKGGIIKNCIIDVITAGTTSSSATLAISSGKSAADLKAALAAASYTGLVACIPVGTAASAIKLTADVTPTVTIAVGTFTAGKFYVVIDYVVSDTL